MHVILLHWIFVIVRRQWEEETQSQSGLDLTEEIEIEIVTGGIETGTEGITGMRMAAFQLETTPKQPSNFHCRQGMYAK